MKLKPLLIAALAVALSGAALAAQDVESTKRVDKRQEAQQHRIDKGVQSGDLTKKEAKRLEKGQARVDGAEKKAAADGKVTAKERAHLENMQDKQRREIYQQRTDKQQAK